MEEWSRWEPVKNISGNFIITSLIMVEEGLTIEVEAEDNDTKFKIKFNGNIDAYRYTNESFYFNIFPELSEKYGDAFYRQWSFFKVKNSDFAQFLSTKSNGCATEFSFEHFCIMNEEEILDVLVRYQPEIEIVNKDQKK